MKADRSPSPSSFTFSSLKSLIHPASSSATKAVSTARLTVTQLLVQATKIDRAWQILIRRFAQAMTASTEPRVEWRRDRQGNSYFAVYDPSTGQSNCFGSAQEVRAWLEQRYYR